MRRFKEFVKQAIRWSGYELTLRTPATDSFMQLLQVIRSQSIDMVIDVGANKGQFASKLRSCGFQGKIISFEPLPDAYSELAALSSTDPDWHIHDRCAVGAVPGTATLNVSGNSVSSSLLPMTEAHTSAARTSRYVDTLEVPVIRLDDVASKHGFQDRRCLLKIDTQGFEWEVLDGAKATLNLCQAVICELSLVQLYEGQRLWLEVIERFEDSDFVLWTLQKGFVDKATGRSLQMDGIFVRESSARPATSLDHD